MCKYICLLYVQSGTRRMIALPSSVCVWCACVVCVFGASVWCVCHSCVSAMRSFGWSEWWSDPIIDCFECWSDDISEDTSEGSMWRVRLVGRDMWLRVTPATWRCGRSSRPTLRIPPIHIFTHIHMYLCVCVCIYTYYLLCDVVSSSTLLWSLNTIVDKKLDPWVCETWTNICIYTFIFMFVCIYYLCLLHQHQYRYIFIFMCVCVYVYTGV